MNFPSFINRPVYYVLCWFLLSACASVKSNEAETGSLPATSLFPYGRTSITDNSLELISSASHFAFSFEGSECQIFASLSDWQDHNYLQYEMDGHGVYQRRLRINKGEPQPTIISAQSSGKHTIVIYKATEAHTGPIFIQKISGKNVKAIKPSSSPLIEFIGNSITCGAAADPSEVPCGQGEYHDQHNAYNAYGPRVARALGVNFVLGSVSGIGIYRNWNSDGPTMPQVYEKTDFQAESNRLWNFQTYQPKVVSIALGTNDFSNGDGKKARDRFDSANFVSNYIRFVQQVKAKYPAAQIALLSSPMMNGGSRTLLQNCLTAVKQNIDVLFPEAEPVAIHFFKPMQARGCTGHPNVEDHAIIAEELVPFYKRLM
ncbi:MAG: GDSL family lipase [Chitinophagaceae bacterium]|nr:MAG: GDSL family lipase [Chitinophagaceae bacterium]